MATLVQLQTWLAEAEQALHTVSLGGAPTVVVDQNGERVEFGRTNTVALEKYIAKLQFQIALLQGTAVTGGPLRVLF